ncbi:MAG: aconitate hydratase AcnA [Spirochaetota bacterium]
MQKGISWYKQIVIGQESFWYVDLKALGGDKINTLPYSLRILLENVLRTCSSEATARQELDAITNHRNQNREIHFYPARVLMQDFTGGPAIVDLAALRDAAEKAGADPLLISPEVPVDLVVDHSVQIDYYGDKDAREKNVEYEYRRNSERYTLLKWAQRYFSNFRVIPPNSGICHQINLEYLGECVRRQQDDILYPDTLVGTDSHTPMINGLGILGWGVGGIEAEAVMLGQPYIMPIPEVLGVKLTGKLSPLATATDLVLRITELLRSMDVVGSFVEFFGPGLKQLSLPDRATIANMSPEYGATVGYFPIDGRTLEYLEFTGRHREAERTYHYAQANTLFYNPGREPTYDRVIELSLSDIEPSIAGPTRPQDRIPLSKAATTISHWLKEQHPKTHEVEITIGSQQVPLRDGSLAIAALTSCTNTSNPAVMLGAGLLAKNAVERGLSTAPWVKTSLAPGSKVVTDYLEASELLSPLEQLGFYLTAYGCTTCIGNSGPLLPQIEQAQLSKDLILTAALSGNRNFSGRIHPRVKASYLMSPLLVVAYALSGTVAIDFESEPLGYDQRNKPVYLRDIWPSQKEIQALISTHVHQTYFLHEYETISSGDAWWQALKTPEGSTFAWDSASTYIASPPFFEAFPLEPPPRSPITKARALLVFYDSVTTDHISPAGAIDPDYPAGKYLEQLGVSPDEFNSYGARRGNHEVMIRGTFGNTRIQQALTTPLEGGYTLKLPEGTRMHVYDAAMEYKREGTDLIILAGKEYGTGSSRDWAAKGTLLLGVKAVIAQSFERIHRSNLVGMGVLPLTFLPGESWQSLGLTGHERFSIEIPEAIRPKQLLSVKVFKDGNLPASTFQVTCRLDSETEIAYYTHGGILSYVLRSKLASAPPSETT